MGVMKEGKKKKKLSEIEIDEFVVAQSEDEGAWTRPVHAKRSHVASLSLPTELALRAEFFSRLHRSKNLNEWLRRVIQERLDMEEAAFHDLKRDYAKSR